MVIKQKSLWVKYQFKHSFPRAQLKVLLTAATSIEFDKAIRLP